MIKILLYCIQSVQSCQPDAIPRSYKINSETWIRLVPIRPESWNPWNDEIMIEGSNLQIFNFPGFKIFVNFDKIKFCRNSVSGFRLTVYSDDSCVMILKDWSNPVQCKESRAGFILITLWYTQKSNTLLTFTKYKINWRNPIRVF